MNDKISVYLPFLGQKGYDIYKKYGMLTDGILPVKNIRIAKKLKEFYKNRYSFDIKIFYG